LSFLVTIVVGQRNITDVFIITIRNIRITN